MKYLKKLFWLAPLLVLFFFIGCEGNKPPDTPGSPAGPTSGIVGESLSFSAHTTDPNDDDIAYMFDWGDGVFSSWSSYSSSGFSVSRNHIFSSTGTYEVRVRAKDIKNKESGWSNGHSIIVSSIINFPPKPPLEPSGPENGYVDSSLNFTTSTIDPDGDSVAYIFAWGDGDTTNWSSYVSSGASVDMSHSYSSEGVYSIKAKAKDENGAESDWSIGREIEIKTLYKVISTYSAPGGSQPNGLTFANGYLWMSSYHLEKGIYQLDTISCNIINHYMPQQIAGFEKGYAGLAFDGTYLWHSDAYGDYGITKLNIPPTKKIDSFTTPDDHLGDLAWDGSYLWSMGSTYEGGAGYSADLRKINVSTGQVLDTYHPVGGGGSHIGLTFDGNNLWISTDNEIAKLDENCSIVYSFEIPSATRLESLAWDGTYLWTASFDQAKIYKIKIY